MAAIVVLTSVAAHDLSRTQDWLGQAGAGRRAKRKAQRIVRAIQTLSTTAHMYPADPFRAGNRQLIVEDHVVSFRRVSRDGADFVFVERISGPGQLR